MKMFSIFSHFIFLKIFFIIFLNFLMRIREGDGGHLIAGWVGGQ